MSLYARLSAWWKGSRWRPITDTSDRRIFSSKCHHWHAPYGKHDWHHTDDPDLAPGSVYCWNCGDVYEPNKGRRP